MRLPMSRNSRIISVAALASVGIIVAGGMAIGATPPNTYTGCLANGTITKIAIGTSPTSACGASATKVSWNERGPRGRRGPAGPTYVATGLVNDSGAILLSSGPVPTIERTSAGHYSFSISGLGTATCPVPQFTGFDDNGAGVAASRSTWECGEGAFSTVVVSETGQDANWSYMLVGTDAP